MKLKTLFFAASILFSPLLFAQSVPQNVIAEQSGSDIRLSWSASQDNFSYHVYLDSFFVAEVSDSSFLDTLTPTTTSATYFVTGCTAAGVCSDPSLSALFEPGIAPDPVVSVPQVQNARIEVVADGIAVLAWDPVIGAEKYNIDKNFNYLATTELTSGTLRDTNFDLQGFPQFEPDAFYRVSAVDEDAANNFGPWSDSVSATDPNDETDAVIAGLEATIEQRDSTILMLEEQILQLEQLIAGLQAQIDELVSDSDPSEDSTEDSDVPSDL